MPIAIPPHRLHRPVKRIAIRRRATHVLWTSPSNRLQEHFCSPTPVDAREVLPLMQALLLGACMQALLLGACISAAHACEVCQYKLFAGGCPVGRRKARERWGDWVVTEDAFDDGDCRNTCCAANEDSCCETDFHFVAGVAGGLFVLIAICVVVCCVECRRRRALGRVVRKTREVV